jgi:hypothetical protein
VADRILARLRVDGVPVAEYVDGSDLDATLAPRPYLHPVRTLAGTVATDARPVDHPWHLGVGVASADVDGWNLWGGPTFRPEDGYVLRADHGRIAHAGFDRLDDCGFTERLWWRTACGEALLAERRTVQARRAGRGWELELRTSLSNAADRPVRLGSPATNGRAGAGYGGLFWRLSAAREPHVYTTAGTGEGGVHDGVAPWLAWTDRVAGFTLVFAGTDAATRADPWFVRIAEYPGVGSQLAARAPLTLPVGGTVTRGLRTLLVDGVLDDGGARDWGGAAAADPRPRTARTTRADQPARHRG